MRAVLSYLRKRRRSSASESARICSIYIARAYKYNKQSLDVSLEGPGEVGNRCSNGRRILLARKREEEPDLASRLRRGVYPPPRRVLSTSFSCKQIRARARGIVRRRPRHELDERSFARTLRNGAGDETIRRGGVSLCSSRGR